MNIGPNAGGTTEKPLGTFDPHSSPAGIVFLGNDFPESHRGHFLVARFGNLIDLPKDVGFDLVEVTMKPATSGPLQAEVRTLLSPLPVPQACVCAGRKSFHLRTFPRSKHATRHAPRPNPRIACEETDLKPQINADERIRIHHECTRMVTNHTPPT